MMNLKDWARQHLVVKVPRDLSLWHWTRSRASVHNLRGLIEAKSELAGAGNGATGQGLYMTTSAVDLIDRGDEVLFATLPAGIEVLMIDPELFGVGFPETLKEALARLKWKCKLPRFRGKVDPTAANPAPEVIDRLLPDLNVAGCAYVYGMHMAFMITQGSALRLGPAAEQERTVAEYVKANPKDRPMLVPYSKIEQWIASRGLRS